MSDKTEKKEMSFLDHLEVLRWHLIRSTIAVLIGAIAIFIGKNIVFDQIILAPVQPDFISYKVLCQITQAVGSDYFCVQEFPFKLSNLTLGGNFTVHIWVSFIGGIILAFPYILFEMWRFIKPGLHEKERKNSRGLVIVGSLLFAFGVAFGYFLISPLSVNFLGTYSVSELVENKPSLSSFINTVTTATLACGIVFELPLLVYFLAKMGLLSAKGMKTYRRHSFVGVLILSAIITPPDIASQILVTIPLVILYEVSIGIAKRIENKKLKAT